jgi:hypothetical protein
MSHFESFGFVVPHQSKPRPERQPKVYGPNATPSFHILDDLGSRRKPVYPTRMSRRTEEQIIRIVRGGHFRRGGGHLRAV